MEPGEDSSLLVYSSLEGPILTTVFPIFSDLYPKIR